MILFFLEVWFEELNSQSNIYKHGHMNGTLIKNNMIDSRVNEETSRRVGLRYKIRVEKGVNIEKWSSGFGFNNAGDYSRIYASGPKTHDIENLDYLFLSATDDVFKGQSFYGDNGLFVAGRPNSNSDIRKDFEILDDYIFAVPLFAVKRRNQKPYSIEEPNGAPKYFNSYTASDRPDGLFHNRVVSRDLRDLRKVISFNQLNTSKILDDTLKQLLTGELQTKEKEIVERIQFGVQPLSSSMLADLGDPILYSPFNRNVTANIGPMPGKFPSEAEEKYDLAATGYGLMLDGSYDIRYRPSSLINWVTKNVGTVEFFIKPFWDGADDDVSQTLFEVTDDLNNALISFKKDGNKLILTQKFDATIDSDATKTIVDLSKQKIYYNGIHHIRVTWDRNNNKTAIYLNGKEVATGWFLLSALNPTTIKIGAIENISSYFSQKSGCVIDEFTVYDKVLDPKKFPQLKPDIINGFAKIHQSFNGMFRSFKDNAHAQQDIIVSIVTSSNGKNLVLQSPYNTIISGDNTPTVYHSIKGDIYNGSWSGLNTNTAIFTLDSNEPDFTGETVWVQHDIVVPNGGGTDNLPTKILKAEMNGQEVSFTKSNEEKREVQLINEDLSIETTHKAWDFNSKRGPKDGYARIIKYKFDSNGTNKYVLPKKLYGYEVIGVKYVDRPLKEIYKNANNELVVELVDTVIYGDSFTVEVALAGFTFDYESYSKSLVSNMMVAKNITITATGNSDTFVIPTSKSLNLGGGVIISFLGVSHNAVNPSTNKYENIDLGEVVYYDKQFVKPIDISGIGTPFITVKFDFVPRLNTIIEIPVLITYQPNYADNLSVWYEYIPYQGILNDKTINVKRISDWKLFSTTLGSGNVFVKDLKENSINNASNRLPGGQKFSYLLTGDDIDFEGEKFTSNGAYSANKKLIFRNNFNDQIYEDKFDENFSVLNTEFEIKKTYGDHQDSKLNKEVLDISFYLQDTKNAINKYMGASCLVVDNLGNIMLFIVGEIKKDPTVDSIVEPSHGDLFKLENSPIILTRRL